MDFFKRRERLFGLSIVMVICNCRHAQTLPETIRIGNKNADRNMKIYNNKFFMRFKIFKIKWFDISGGLFDHSDTVQEIAFRYAVDRVNSDRDIMPRSRLTAQIERIREQDSFYASKQGKRAYK